MRVFITSTPAALEPLRCLAADVVRENGSVPVFREPDGLEGHRPVDACVRQVGRADLVLAIVGRRHDDVPEPEEGGDGRHPWVWWETRAAFERGLPVQALLAEGDEGDEDADPVTRDLRGELARLAVLFDPDDPDAFRDLVGNALRDDTGVGCTPRTAPDAVALREWPPPELPERPYPVLLPYTHPDLLAGRDREVDTLRRRLARPVAITGLHALSGTGKSSLLAGGLVPLLRAEGRPVAFERHPTENGIVARLFGELVDDEAVLSDNDATAFVDALAAVRRTANAPPVLVLDQFEDLFRDLPGADDARAVVGTLLAASVQRLPGLNEPVCRWLLAYRQEFHSDVVRWLRNMNPVGYFSTPLPVDLATPERFQTYVLPPLGTPPPGAKDPTSAATQAFEDAITRPLNLKNDEGVQRYSWTFENDGAERLARAFGEARLERPDAPLAPELQVVLAHLLDNADRSTGAVLVPDDPAALIERALEEHLRRSLDVAFPGNAKETRLGRTRALLALRELADATGRRGEGRTAVELALAIGSEGNDVLEKLATARTRIVLLEEHDGEQVYVLSHDRMAEVLVRLFDDGTFTGLGVDAELLALRRVVALHSELFASGEVDEGTRISRKDARRVERHAEALLWGEERRRWWDACRERLRSDRRRLVVRWGIAVTVVLVVSLGAWTLAERRTTYQGWIQEVVTARDRAVALGSLVRLMDVAENWPAFINGFDSTELLHALKRREEAFEVPMDVLEHGMGAFDGEERALAVLRVVELVLPWVEERPEDPELIANLVWPLDYSPGRDLGYLAQAQEMRDLVLEPLRRLKPPPVIADDDPDWVDIPAGTFLMGSPEGEGDDDEHPQHKVTISAFRMLRHEVTNAEYRRLVPDHPARAIEKNESERRPFYEEHFTDDDLPAAFINWYQAYTYAAWLGGRLPTEAEWEYAARANCPHAYCDREGKEATGNDVAWTEENSETVDVSWRDDPYSLLALGKTREPNPWGLYDVLGNLWEWNADWHGDYTDKSAVDPAGPPATSGGLRVFRGGSFWDEAVWSRVASRLTRFSPGSEHVSQGCRVVLPRGPEL